MADERGELDQDRFIEWLQKHWKGPKTCPVCESNQWTIGRDLLISPTRVRGQMLFGGRSYPLAFVTCTVCGHTLFFNAVVAGLIEENKTLDLQEQSEEVLTPA